MAALLAAGGLAHERARSIALRAPAGLAATCWCCSRASALTVIFDMVVAVTAGLVLSSLLFIRRMARGLEGDSWCGGHHPALHRAAAARRRPLRRGGAALLRGRRVHALTALGRRSKRRPARAVVLDVADVPAIDATGLVNLESLITRLNRDGVKVIPGWRAGAAAARAFAPGRMAQPQGPPAHLPGRAPRDRERPRVRRGLVAGGGRGPLAGGSQGTPARRTPSGRSTRIGVERGALPPLLLGAELEDPEVQVRRLGRCVCPRSPRGRSRRPCAALAFVQAVRRSGRGARSSSCTSPRGREW